jgi:hypothetical protein
MTKFSPYGNVLNVWLTYMLLVNAGCLMNRIKILSLRKVVLLQVNIVVLGSSNLSKLDGQVKNLKFVLLVMKVKVGTNMMIIMTALTSVIVINLREVVMLNLLWNINLIVVKEMFSS